MTAVRTETLAEGVTLHCGDCLTVLPTLADNSVDSIVTDPPYELKFMGKGWDGTGIAFKVDVWKQALRVLKPGGHLLAFGGTRTYHRMACAIEDAGFEIRDCIQWLYGSGFPKSLDVSKAIDKRKDWSALPKLQSAIHAARKTRGMSQSAAARAMGLIGPNEDLGGGGFMWFETGLRAPTREQWRRLKAALHMGDEFDLCFEEAEREITGTVEEWADRSNYALTSKDGFRRDKPASSLAAQWSGWGTALKPACEPIVLARKPLSESTVAANVLKWGTGALNIDGCRVFAEKGDGVWGTSNATIDRDRMFNGSPTMGDYRSKPVEQDGKIGRWPANVIHDGGDEVVGAFPETSSGASCVSRASGADREGNTGAAYGKESRPAGTPMIAHGDSGSAARFFYTTKADADDRLGSKHPTVKPVDLKQYLSRLVTPKGGLILDPFAGTGTTGEAAIREGFRAILIERESEYQDDIRRRMKLAMAGPDERAREAIKARMKDKPIDHGPLFGGVDTPPHRQTDLRSLRGRTIGPTGLKW